MAARAQTIARSARTDHLLDLQPRVVIFAASLDATAASSARAAEQPGLQLRVWRSGAQPDGEQRSREVVARNRALDRVADGDANASARLVRNAQALAGFHVRHQPFERLDALLERRELARGVVLEALVPALAQIGAAHIAHEVEDELFGTR